MQSIRQIVLGLGLLAAANLAQAALITLDGDHFSVTYDDAQVGLYNQGQLSGSLDTVYFLPTTFVAVTGGAPATTQAVLQFTLNIDPGYSFAGLGFAENGNYFLSGGGLVRAAANLQAVNPDTLANATLALSSDDALTRIGATTSWALAGLLGPAGLDSPQTLQITLDNALTSEPSQGVGLIRKTYVGFRIETRANAVPEPSALALMLGGVLAAVLAGRRRRL